MRRRIRAWPGLGVALRRRPGPTWQGQQGQEGEEREGARGHGRDVPGTGSWGVWGSFGEDLGLG